MRKYLIERALPGAGDLTPDELRAIARKSNGTLAALGGRAQWVESYVTTNAITCVWLAEDEDAIREHAARGGFPVTEIRAVEGVIDPLTAG